MAADAPARKPVAALLAIPLVLAGAATFAVSSNDSDESKESNASLNYYFGNLHAHTSYSDGSGTPDEAYKQAKKSLDFIAITEHNHEEAEAGAGDRRDGLLIATNHSLYEKLKEAAGRHNSEGSFVTLWGQEFSTINKGNHSNALFVDEVINIDNGDYKGLYQSLGNQILQFNHSWDSKNEDTDYGVGQFHGDLEKLNKAAAKNLRLIEVINGPGTKNETGLKATLKGEPRYRKYLSYGLKLGPTADQDNHYFTWGDLTDARTVVLAPQLTRADILQALRQFRCYASTDKNLRIRFEIDGREIGSSFTSNTRKLKVSVKIADDDEPKATYRIQAVYGNPITHESKIVKLGDFKGDSEEAYELETEYDNTFVYLRVSQHPGQASKTDMALTAPVWIAIKQQG